MNTSLNLEPEWLYRAEACGRQGVRAPLSALFRYSANCFPTKVALFDGLDTLSFDELEHGAQRIAALLRDRGTQFQQRVVVLTEKRSLIPMLAVAIWKIGAVYVPLDSQEAMERLEGVLEELQPIAVIGNSQKLALLNVKAPKYEFDFLRRWAARPDVSRVTQHLQPDERDTAYIIYTSGSSGRPKGVMISHESLLDFFYGYNRVMRYSPDARVLSFAPFHFDVSFEDTILPLSVGAYVYQFRGMPVARLVLRILQRERITHLVAVSSVLAMVSQESQEILPEKLTALEMVMTGAEVCDPKVINVWKARMPRARVVNGYGPTEATVVCLLYVVDTPEEGRTSSYPIGQPIDGIRLKLMGDAREVRAAGELGELWIGGSQVMIGYYGRPADTSRCIVEHEGTRYYRSGDVCRYDRNGNLEFVGRRDDQVKIGGRRIGLGELRQFALGLPGVSGASVGAVKHAEGVVAALVIVADRPVSFIAEIASSLVGLPPYMRPRVIALASNAPLKSSGKLDEQELMVKLSAACKTGSAIRYFLNANGGFVPVRMEGTCGAAPQNV